MPKSEYKKQEDGRVYCPKCKEVFEESHFQKVPHKTQPDRYVCKINNKNFNSGGRNRRKATNYEYGSAEYSRFYRMIRKFGSSEEEYNKLFDEQEGCCAICYRHQSELDKALSVDHCHETGKVRGLLCINCNSGLGQFKDNVSLLQKAKTYLLNKLKIVKDNSYTIPYKKGNGNYFRERRYIAWYGINLKQYNDILQSQNYSCKICNVSETLLTKALAVDHCHRTDEVRGLLCHFCNKGLGLFYDNLFLLQNSINYIVKHKS